MILTILFWLLILIDLAGVALWFLLGLAAARPSHTSPLSVTFLLLVVPVVLVALAALLFLFGRSPLSKGLGFLMAAAPLLLLVGSYAYGQYNFRQYQRPDGTVARFKSEGMRKVEDAIVANDAAAVAAAARNANLKEQAIDGSNVLVFALRELEKHPGPPDTIRALIAGGADVNRGAELPLAIAIYASAKAGPEVVKLLLDAGANPNQRDQFQNPAYFAATGVNVDVSVLKMLLDRGADLSLRTQDGRNVLASAGNTQNWRAALLLLERGADPSATTAGPHFRETVEQSHRTFGDQPGMAELLQYLAEKHPRPPDPEVKTLIPIPKPPQVEHPDFQKMIDRSRQK
jgi:hypothetical protein